MRRAGKLSTIAVASALALVWIPTVLADSLSARLEGDRILVAAPHLKLLEDSSLEKLKNGSSVAFDFSLLLGVGSRANVRRRAFERFVVSYDLWEEKFSVTGLGKPRPSTSRLAAAAVPAWCLQNIALPAADLPPEQPLWIRLEVRQPESKRDRETEAGLRLSDLIDLLSRPAGNEPNRWLMETGPLRLSDLKRLAAAGLKDLR